MAYSVGTIYFGHESSYRLPRALQTSINVYSSAGNHVLRKAINAKANGGRTNTAGSGLIVAFGARFPPAKRWPVAPNRSQFLRIKVSVPFDCMRDDGFCICSGLATPRTLINLHKQQTFGQLFPEIVPMWFAWALLLHPRKLCISFNDT